MTVTPRTFPEGIKQSEREPIHILFLAYHRFILRGHGLEFYMKYHILHDFRTSTPIKEKSSDHFKDLHELLTNFDVNLTPFLRGVINYVSNV